MLHEKQSERSIDDDSVVPPPPPSAEKFNLDVFKRLGELGLLGVTASPDYGGSGMDATAACIVHEELSAADPALCLSYLGELEARDLPLSREVALSTSSRYDEIWLYRTCTL